MRFALRAAIRQNRFEQMKTTTFEQVGIMSQQGGICPW
jgi:hypothetical protein